MQNCLNTIVKFLRESIFPVFCLGCEKEGERICADCLKTVNTIGVFGHRHIAVTPYNEDWLIGKIVRGFKYNYEEELLIAIEKLVSEFISAHLDCFFGIDFITPVPLHKKRQAERGFNQSETIAQIIGKIINKPVINLIIRQRNTKHQARLNKEERLLNVKDAFVISRKVNGRVLLVDDVFTTGSTMRECTKALINAGARDVLGFSLARG